MARKQPARKKSATAKTAKKKSGRSSAKRTKKVVKKRKSAAKATAKRKTAVKRKPKKSVSRTKRATKKAAAARALGRPRVAGTAELELMFRNDLEAREIFEFLGVKTLKELETLSPDEIVERLTAPMMKTVGRIRKALALNNRCLSGDQKFAVAFKKQLS